MKLPDVKDINAYVEALFGEEWTAELRALAKPVNPLAECSPTPWAKSPEGVEL